jgi:hypothetical protein
LLRDIAAELVVLALLDAGQKPLWAAHATLAVNCFQYSEYDTTPWLFKDWEFLLLGTIARQGDGVVFSAVEATQIISSVVLRMVSTVGPNPLGTFRRQRGTSRSAINGSLPFALERNTLISNCE